MVNYLFQGLVISSLVLTLGLAILVRDDGDLEPRRNFVAEAGLSVSDRYHSLSKAKLDPEALKTPPFPQVEQNGL